MGIVVAGTGPQVMPAKATVAPAAAPRAIWYASTTWSSHWSCFFPSLSRLLDRTGPVTLVTNSATLAKTSATTPAPTGNARPEKPGVLNSRPTLRATRMTPVKEPPSEVMVTGRNSNRPPGLRKVLGMNPKERLERPTEQDQTHWG